MARILWIGLVALLLVGCRRASPECRVRVKKLRHQIAAIDWSVVGLHHLVPYHEIPVGEGRIVPDDKSDTLGTIVVRGTSIVSHGEVHANDASLDKWLYDSARIFHPESQPWPFYVLVTQDTRVALVRRVAAILKPLGETRLAVRPVNAMKPWPPRKDRQAFYDAKIRGAPSDKWSQELVMSVLVPAEGCSEAVEVAKHGWMSPGDRLKRLPDAFEKCACEGDMDTMAALYWFQVFDGFVPIRWNAWDDAVANQVGDDATYAELAAALTAKYRAAPR